MTERPDGVTATLAAFAASVGGDGDAPALADEATHAAARLVLDTVGCLLGGAGTEVGHWVRGWTIGAFGAPAGDAATIVGEPRPATTGAAAYANGRQAALLDADETYPSDRQTTHLAAATVAAALAVSEARDLDRRTLLATVTAGYEVGARISDALVPHEGATGTGLRAGWGPGSVLGATAAAGRAAGLDGWTLQHALGIAGTHVGPAPLQWVETVPAPMAKSADAGWHAWTAVAASSMAADGLTGYPKVLDGERGLWRALGYAAFDADAAVDRLGERWIVTEAAFKRWPCQYWMQPALTALASILGEHAIDPASIEEIELATNDKSLASRFADPAPQGEIDRAFSFPHAAAMLVLGVRPGAAWLADTTADDPSVQHVRDLVRVVRHEDAGRLGDWVVDHQIRDLPARAIVVAGGRRHVAEARHGLGNPWSPTTRFSDHDLVRKFEELAEAIPDATRAAIVTWILDPEPGRPVRDLTARLRDAGRPWMADTEVP